MMKIFNKKEQQQEVTPQNQAQVQEQMPQTQQPKS